MCDLKVLLIQGENLGNEQTSLVERNSYGPCPWGWLLLLLYVSESVYFTQKDTPKGSPSLWICASLGKGNWEGIWGQRRELACCPPKLVVRHGQRSLWSDSDLPRMEVLFLDLEQQSCWEVVAVILMYRWSIVPFILSQLNGPRRMRNASEYLIIQIIPLYVAVQEKEV